MSFLTPIIALIAAGIAVPALIALYFLKRRRRRVPVGSTLLWSRALRDLRVNAPFQRLRRNLLLLMQLLVLIALLLAFARPVARGTARQGTRVVIVVDHSASMNATDTPPTRLDRAKQDALKLIDELGSGRAGRGAPSSAMVISFAHQARVVQPFTTDTALLRAAIASIPPTDQVSRFDQAVSLLDPFTKHASQTGDTAESMLVYVLSDGRFQNRTASTLTGADVSYTTVGEPTANNAGIVALSARHDPADPTRIHAFARVSNFSRNTLKTTLTVQRGDQTLRVLPVDLPAHTRTDDPAPSSSFQITLPLTEQTPLRLHLDHRDDLACDNTAHLMLSTPAQPRVALVSDGNPFLARALRTGADGAVVVVSPKEYREGTAELSDRDLLVFDGHSPGSTPGVDSVYFAAAPPIVGLRYVAQAGEDDAGAHAVLSWRHEHPLLRHVLLDNVLMIRPGRLSLPTHAQTLATTRTGPVIASIGDEGVQHILIAFDVRESNWPMQVGFPVFMSNVARYVGGRGSKPGVYYRPGQPASPPVSPVSRRVARYTGPGGITLESLDDTPGASSGRVTLPPFLRTGLYHSDEDVPDAWRLLAVNLVDEIESDLRPVRRLSLHSGAVEASVSTILGRTEVWRAFAFAALSLLMLEWWVYTRRAHL